jgi:succinate dehydrogenase / fumarate reductase cytochrome b subunit
MSKSALLKSSIAKKYWMALTGLFLCLFLVGHLLGNLQLVLKTGEEGRRAFNEYAYFMGHNILIKIMAYVTYISIIFHAVDGFVLTFKNKKARPQGYAYERADKNSKLPSRYMAILGTVVLVFICTHMANFWWKQKVTGDVPMHFIVKESTESTQNPMDGQPMNIDLVQKFVLTTDGSYKPYSVTYPSTANNMVLQNVGVELGTEMKNLEEKHKTELFDKKTNLKVGEGYKDLHTVVMNFFGHENNGQPTNDLAWLAVILYTVSMFVLSFHLWHGFASAFQTLGINHKRYTPFISIFGKAFAILVPLAFAIIPILIFLNK